MKQVKTTNSEVFIGSEVLSSLNIQLLSSCYSKIFILVDENTLQHCITELITNVELLQGAEIIEINSGEENKTIDICYQIWSTLSYYKADRNSLLINLGGGVITDMGGFIASTYKRGIDFINVPTTLLAQIDASVGGKVGVDLEDLKNMIGVFNEPKGVFVNPNFLKTLDKKQMLSGYAEALKHALISDKEYWDYLKEGMLSDANQWEELISKSVHIKNNIVLADPKEKNQRKILNFGHTIGHAIESFALKGEGLPLLHGEAIAIGIVCESYISYKNTGLSVDELEEIAHTILNFYTPFKIDNVDYNELLELMGNDKKNENNKINFSLLTKIGEAEINKTAEVKTIKESLDYYKSLIG